MKSKSLKLRSMKCNSFLAILALLLAVQCSEAPVKDLPGCERIEGMPGPEDFDFDPAGKRLLVSSQERRLKNPDGSWIEGGIFSVPIEKPQARLMTLKGRDGMPFHPHGISFVPATSLLYVVSHPTPVLNVIEVFSVHGDILEFKERLTSDLLIQPNDIAAMADGEFYVTNDHGTSGWRRVIEDLFAASWSGVVHYRAGIWSNAAGGMSVANGIQVNRKGDRLYVGATRDRGIHVFPRAEDGSIGPRIQFISMNSGTDNLMWENDRILDAAGHHSMFAFLRHVANQNSLSPSDITRVDVESGRTDLLFGTDGTRINAISTGLVLGDKLYVSQVFEPFLLACRMP